MMPNAGLPLATMREGLCRIDDAVGERRLSDADAKASCLRRPDTAGHKAKRVFVQRMKPKWGPL